MALYRPDGPVKDFVIFLSGDGGWSFGVLDMAQALVSRGVMVAGVSVPQFLAALETDSASCVYPDGDLENLSHYVQGFAQLPAYHTPLLVGYSSGATLAYSMITQAPPGTFGGALSLGFCPDLDLSKRLCQGEDLHYSKSPDGKNFDLLPTSTGRTPWIVLQGQIDQVCDLTMARAFVKQVPEGTLVELPKVGHGFGVQANWMPQYLAAFGTLAAAVPAAPAPPAPLADLPIVEMRATGDRDLLAVLLSGDGGWAGLDRELADELAAKGVSVVGLDSLRYFWRARTPEGLAADLERIVRYYAGAWQKSRVLLIGYSQGADVLPFAVSRLPERDT